MARRRFSRGQPGNLPAHRSYYVGLIAAVAAIAYASFSKGAGVYAETPEVKAIALQHRFRTWPEHDAIMEKLWPKPCILELDRLVLYGAHHTSDRNDPSSRTSPALECALYFTMREYRSEAGGKANERLARDLLAKRTNVDGLRNSLATLADVDRVWKRDFPGHSDWRVIWKEPKGGCLAAISDDSRRVRGEHMARTLIDLHRKASACSRSSATDT